MKTIPSLTKAEAVSNYCLYLEFADGVSGKIDLSEWKGNGVFEFWNDEMEFKNFKITINNKLEWKEDVDVDPDAFYLKLVNKNYFEYAGVV